jgi:low affinity Fe/Cu permease
VAPTERYEGPARGDRETRERADGRSGPAGGGPLTVRDRFAQMAHGVADQVGTPWAFLLACTIVAVWAVTGPLFGFSDTWQLVINTGTTIITFLMVFLIQNTQNRDAKALHLKLDELIRALHSARDEIIDVEEEADDKLAQLQDRYRRLHEQAEPPHEEAGPGNAQEDTQKPTRPS